MGLRESIGRGLNLAGDVAGAVGQAAGAVGQAGLGLAKAATTVPEGAERSPLGRGAAVLQGAAAGFAGRPDLAPQSDAEIAQQRAQAAQQALQQLNAQFQTLKNATSIVNQLPEDRRQDAADSLAPQIAQAIPGGVKLFEEMLAAPTIAEGLERAFEGDPVFEQLLEIDPTGATAQKFITSDQGLDYITRLGSVASQGKLLERIPQVTEFLQANLPEEFKRLEVGGITLEELQSVNEALPPEMRLSPGLIASAEERPDVLLQFGLTLPEFDRDIIEGKQFNAPTVDDKGNLVQTNKKTKEVKVLLKASEIGPSASQKSGIRKEFTKGSGEFIKVRDAFSRVRSTSSTAAGDLALIFNFMKVLDPGSVVRESEFATAETVVPAPERILLLRAKFFEARRLSDEARAGIISEAEGLFKGAVENQIKLEQTFGNVAQAGGLDAKVGGAIILDYINEDRELVTAPDRLAAAGIQPGALATEEDVQRIARQIGSTDPTAIAEAALAEGLRLQ